MTKKEGHSDLPDPTLPDSVPIVVEEMEDDDTEALRLFEDVLRELLAAISRGYDLSTLDGLTVVNDMAKASADLDVGVELPQGDSTPPINDDIAVCGASANHVMRNGKLKSHILILRDIVVGLWTGFSEDRSLKSEASQFALHTLIHECAHVEATSKFDDAFPIILRPVEGWDWLDRIRWRVILACWDEYAACSASAIVGKNPLDGYVEVYLKALKKSASVRMSLMKQCDADHDWGKMWDATSTLYGTLMKYACYVLGTMDRMELEGEQLEVPELQEAMGGSWFAPYYERLGGLCRALMDDYGKWESREPFKAIGDLLEEVVKRQGVTIRRLDNGGFHVDVNFPSRFEMMAAGMAEDLEQLLRRFSEVQSLKFDLPLPTERK